MKGQLLNKIIFIVLLSPMYVFAQPASPANTDITGVWKGALYNDTTKKYIPFEIAISEEKGKLSGYSYILFDIDGYKEMGIKKIKLKRKDYQVAIEDVEMISNTYRARPPRGVRFHSTVNLSVNDTAMQLTGKWNTNRTWEYGPNTGTIQLQRSINYAPAVLFKELVKLKLDQDLSFVKTIKKAEPVIAINEKPNEIKSPVDLTLQSGDVDKPKEMPAFVAEKKTPPVVEKAANIETKPLEQPAAKPTVEKPEETVAPAPEKILTKLIINDLSAIKTKAFNELIKVSLSKTKPAIISLTVKKKEVLVAPWVKTMAPSLVTRKTEPVAVTVPARKENKPPAEIVRKPVITEKPKAITVQVAVATVPVKTENKTTAVVVTPPEQKKQIPVVAASPAVPGAAANVLERKMKSEQSVFFESDSLVLTLYDNGDVDGDTVSVLMNGQIIFAKQGLSTKANSKTIYVDKATTDSLSMIMYAENLGSIPPNTGLLIIMDGQKRYEVRFSADLKTNAAILLRRRIKEK